MGRKKRTVALVLGSGGARGLAHIGIIEELLNRGYEITSVRYVHGGAGRRHIRRRKTRGFQTLDRGSR